MLLLLEWLGCITGVVGSTMLAANTTASRWGFAWYLASNVSWIGFGVATQAWGLVTMQLAFTGVSVFGLVRWFAHCPRRSHDPAPSPHAYR
jgi:hypothetical protein